MRLSDLLSRLASVGLGLQDPGGALPPGGNGPHGDPETPVRNTAHWLILFADAHARTGDTRYRHGVVEAYRYLAGAEARPTGRTFHCRTNPHKDAVNGLIGQAWVVEGLVAAARVLEDEAPLRLAEEVVLLHPQDDETGLWEVVELDGDPLGLDRTFNHQLWFAAAAAMLARVGGSDLVDDRVRRFLRLGTKQLRLRRNGRIIHRVVPFRRAGPGDDLRWALQAAVQEVRRRDQERVREIGYHAFNLYGFALLKDAYPEDAWWGSVPIRRCLDYIRGADFVRELEGNPYGYPYNPPGFEVPFVLDTFGLGDPSTAAEWIGRQVERTFEPATGTFSRNTPDPTTLTARAYEATRCRDMDIPSMPA